MEYRYLGRTGVRVSEACLGTMTFGNEADEDTSRAIMGRAYEAGINFFDTANVYNGGRTEEIVGRWLGARRDDIVLASKAHFPMGEGVNDRGSSRRHITRSVEGSLKRLQTDRLDLLYLHHADEHAALEESLLALDLLVRQGKIVYGAVSNYAAWQTMKALAVASERGYAPIVAHQPMYNLVKRQTEVELFPMAQSEGLAICPYNPLGGGLLTGKYQEGRQGRLKESEMYGARYSNETYWQTTERFVRYARENGYDPAPLAVAWVMSHPAVTSAIMGARNLDQFSSTIQCADIKLTPEQREEITGLSPTPPKATDR